APPPPPPQLLLNALERVPALFPSLAPPPKPPDRTFIAQSPPPAPPPSSKLLPPPSIPLTNSIARPPAKPPDLRTFIETLLSKSSFKVSYQPPASPPPPEPPDIQSLPYTTRSDFSFPEQVIVFSSLKSPTRIKSQSLDPNLVNVATSQP
ncbi:hypothetical protein A2U01_0039834, partial [Trifolium medium]|nr:hypothetical protein [Trifolium medium]